MNKHSLARISLVCLIVAVFSLSHAVVNADSFSLPDIAETTGKHLIAETRDFAATPFQLEKGNFLITLGVAAAVGLGYGFDGEIRNRLQSSRSRVIDSAAGAGAIAGDPFLHMGAAALLYGGGVLVDSPRWQETGEILGEALILADGVTLLLKGATGRARPSAADRKSDFRPFGFKTNHDSFPSMHTASSFAAASVIARTSESLPVAVASYLAASFVGFSRMNQNKHWASDVLLGAAIGELAGRVATGHHGRSERIAFIPIALEGGGGMALTGRY